MFLKIFVAIIILIPLFVLIYDRYFQTKNLVLSNYPLIGRFRYLFHELRPFVRQYFFDDNEFVNRIVINWILDVSSGKTGYFGFDKFDSTRELHEKKLGMIHSANPYNKEEMEPKYPLIGEKRKLPFQFKSYIYRSAMSLGALSFEATSAMAAACSDVEAPFNTGEGGFSVHHVPRIPFSHDKKYFKSIKIPDFYKNIYKLIPAARLKNNWLDIIKNRLIEKGEQDLYLFCNKNFVLYTIDWSAPLNVFPKQEEVTKEFGNVIFQIGSGLYGLKKHTKNGELEFNWERFKKIMSFCKAVEIKLAQGAKQSGGILKSQKNTKTVSEIRGVEPGIDLISPNRFPFYDAGGEKEFFDFIEKVSENAGGKPVGIKIVISDESNIEPIAKQIASNPKVGPDFITIDGGDGGSGAAPVSLSILFGKKIHEALEVAINVLDKHKVRDKVKIFSSAKLYAPHMSARALAIGADAIGNARSIMISAGCIRAGLCSGEKGNCPVGIATMNKRNRKAYSQTWKKKVSNISNYINAHNHGIIEVASIAGVKSPHLLNRQHLVK